MKSLKVKKNCLFSALPGQLINEADPILKSLSTAYGKIASDIQEMINGLKDIHSLYKKSNKGTCYFIRKSLFFVDN